MILCVNVSRTLCTASAFLAAILYASALAQNPSPPSRDRVFLRDIEGIWVNEQYLKALIALRAPHAAAKKMPPVVIAIKREGRAFPIVVTDFNKASVQTVLDVEPDAKPGSYRLVVGAGDRPMSSEEVKYVYFQGIKNAQGKFDRLRFAEIFLMKGKWADYIPLPGEISPYLNRLVLSGRYQDEQGRGWEFSESGEARWPDQKFAYELSLNDPGAGCEYLQTEDLKEGANNKRFGYAWKNGKLSIYPTRMVSKKIRCDTRPLAVLTPQ
ncbi:MAG TPA: hypothetical protein VJT81_01670 [Burkholderiales bacterium]|nr:hypothetical protein [Burkholderiales bacterium]